MINDIVLIAPNEILSKKARAIIEELEESVDIFEGAMSNGLNIAKKAVKQGAKIIISRGGTANLIRNNLNVPVIEIKFSNYDFIRAVNKARKYSNDIAILGFEQVIKDAQKMTNVFPVKVNTIKLNDEIDIENKIRQLTSQGIKVFIGGSSIVRLATKYERQGVLLESDKDNIIEAILKAKDTLRTIISEEVKFEKIKIILNYTSDGIIVVDKGGIITEFNLSARKMLSIDTVNVTGRHIDNIIPEIKTCEVLFSGEAQLGKLYHINYKTFVVNKVPIVVNREIKGGVITFRELDVTHDTKIKIHNKISHKGHVAKNNLDNIIGTSRTIQKVKEKAEQFAKVDSTVFILGETGTGKELFAQSIHSHSERKNNPFIAVNCAALSENLLESELFGYVSGAFTGARKEGKAGLFELANTGTIFLDEISEMSLRVQAKLLRVIQEREVVRIGDDKVIPIDVRIISASNKYLPELVKEGKFREDLYYRLCVLILKIPPLRERKEDIEEIVNYIIKKKNKEMKKFVKGISSNAVKRLMMYHWPGNIRQLNNIIERAMVITKENCINEKIVDEILSEVEDFKLYDEKDNNISDFNDYNKEKDVLKKLECEMIKKVLEETEGNKTIAAKRLGISTTTLWRRLKEINK